MFSKLLLIAVLIVSFSACGGQMMPPTVPTPTGGGGIPPTPITVDQVFDWQPHHWVFSNTYGDITVIDVTIPSPDTSVWHYTKTMDRAYWGIGAPNADLLFYLEKDSSGRAYSPGGHVSFPNGCPWCDGPLNYEYVIIGPSSPRPYLIIGNSGDVSDTTFSYVRDDIGVGPSTRWKSIMYVSNGELISEQFEGPCIHEKWHFQIGRGLMKVEPMDIGNCTGLDANGVPMFTRIMTRQN